MCENAAGQVLVSIDGLRDATAPDSDAALLLLNAQGDTLWSRRTAGPTNDAYRDVMLGNDGNFVLIGQLNTYSQWLKISPSGQVLAQTNLAFSPTNAGSVMNLVPDVSGRGGYWVLLYSDNYQSRQAVHLTENGVPDLRQPVVNAAQTNLFYDIRPLPGSAGYLASLDGRLARLSPTLDTVWTRNYRGGLRQVRLLPDGNAVANGEFYASGGIRVYLAKVAPASGQLLRDTVLASAGGASQYVRGLAVEPGTGNYVFSGFSTRTPLANQPALFFGLLRAWRVTPAVAARPRPAPLAAWPNPVGPEGTLTLRAARPLRGELRLRDARGRVVRRWPARPEAAQPAGQRLGLAGLPAGVYLLSAEQDDGAPLLTRVLCP